MLFNHSTETNDGKMREAIRHECILAQKHYHKTGLRVTQAEVKEWIAQLRQGRKVDVPKCHRDDCESQY